MCDFWSAIVVKDGRIFTHHTDSHEDMKKENNLNDTKPIECIDFIPIQIVPKKQFEFEKEVNKENWDFQFEGNKPDWWSNKIEKSVWKRAEKEIADRVIFQQEIDEISGKRGLIIKDSKIKKVSNTIIKALYGTSQVGQMLNSSHVGQMLNSSQVGQMSDSSHVGEMWGSSQVGQMSNSSHVGQMLNSSQVGQMWDSSQVGQMLDSSQVGQMLNSSQVGQMWDSSQVGQMLDSSQVGQMLDSSQVGEMWDSSAIIKLIKSIYCVVRIWHGNVEKLEKGTVIRFKDGKAEIEHKQ